MTDIPADPHPDQTYTLKPVHTDGDETTIEIDRGGRSRQSRVRHAGWAGRRGARVIEWRRKAGADGRSWTRTRDLLLIREAL